MVRIFPLLFILLWSSAFITTKPIIDNSEPFTALAFRFFFVAIGFYFFSPSNLKKPSCAKKNILLPKEATLFGANAPMLSAILLN